MDPKLKKLLNKPFSDPTCNFLGNDFYKEISHHILTDSNYLITVPGAGKTSIALGIISEVISSKVVWYIAPPVSVNLYQIFHIKSALNDVDITVMTENEKNKSDCRMVVWSSDIFMDYLADLGSLTMPDLIIFDDAEFLGHPDMGTVLETCFLCLPEAVPVLVLASSAANSKELSAWLEAACKRSCRLLEINLPRVPIIPAFISSKWDMVPLVDRKRLSGKVKRLLKEKSGFNNFKAASFIKQLVSFIRAENLTPAIVLMPSEKDCDLAVNACSKIISNVGEMLTQPQITTVLDRYPFLKDYPMLTAALSKQIAPFHSGHHPLWCTLVEHFLSFGSIDIVFVTLDSVEKMINRVKTAVFCIEQKIVENKNAYKITQWKMDRVTSLVGRTETDNAGCIALIHTPDVDAVRIKDMLLHINGFLNSTFQCNCRSVLGILTNDRDPVTIMDRSLFKFQNKSFEELDMEEFQTQLVEELPDARCIAHIKSVTSLKNLYLKLTLEISNLANRIKTTNVFGKSQTLNERQHKLECVFSQLPCNECVHLSLCHKRGTKKFRILMEKYYEIQSRLEKSITGFSIDFQYYVRCLQEFGLVNQKQHLTKEGALALRTGLNFPQSLIECIREGLLPVDTSAASFVLIGGFAECPEWDGLKITENIQEQCSKLLPAFEKMATVLDKTKKRMLRFGILSPEYSLSQSAVMLAWKKRADIEILTRQTGIPIGLIVKLIQKTEYLSERLRYKQVYIDFREI